MMRWLEALKPWPKPAVRASDCEGGTGAEAKERSLDALAVTSDKWSEVRAVSGSLRELRQRNQFAEQIALSMKGHHST